MEQEEPLTPIVEWAVEIHEHYLALTESGFTTRQAENIICAGIQSGWFADEDQDAEL